MDMGKMMKELQKMQSKMAKLQSEMEMTVFEAEAGGGAVKVTLNGKGDLQAVRLQKEVVDPDDVEALEDLILAAFQSAKEKVDSAQQQKFGGMTKGLGIPGF